MKKLLWLLPLLVLVGCGKTIFSQTTYVHYHVYVENSEGAIVTVPLMAEMPVEEKFDTNPVITPSLEIPLLKGAPKEGELTPETVLDKAPKGPFIMIWSTRERKE